MTFHAASSFAGILQPHEFELIQRVYSKISAEDWFTCDPERQGDFGAYVIRTYTAGLGEERRLYELCLAAAKDRFSRVTNAETVPA